MAICGAPSASNGAISVDVAVLLYIALAFETIWARSDSSLVKTVGTGATVTEVVACRLVLDGVGCKTISSDLLRQDLLTCMLVN